MPIEERYTNLIELIHWGVDAIIPHFQDDTAYLKLILCTDEEENHNQRIEAIEEAGGSCEFIPSDNGIIIFRLL